MKTNEERDDQDGETARQRERRRERRGRLKHEESVVGEETSNTSTRQERVEFTQYTFVDPLITQLNIQ